MDDALDEGQGSSTEAEQVAALQKKIEALEKDNAKYREERRRSEFIAKYGEEITDSVADLPEEKREAWADKLLKLQSSATPEPDGSAPSEAPKEEPKPGLAAVVNDSASGAPGGEQTLTPDEFKKYVDLEGLVSAAQKYGHLVRFPDIDNPLATGQAAQIQGTYRPPSS